MPTTEVMVEMKVMDGPTWHPAGAALTAALVRQAGVILGRAAATKISRQQVLPSNVAAGQDTDVHL